MAAGTKQYTAIFAIGAKLLGSFKGVMNAANARLAKLRASTLSFGKSIVKLTAAFSGLGLAIAGFGVGEVLRSLFKGATEQAKEARQRINSTIASFLQLKKIQQGGGFDYAKAQLDIIYKQNEALGKQGVLHTDIYNEMTKQLAQGGVPPRQIKAAMGAMGDLLVKTRGVNATEEEGAELANAVVRAIHGKTKALQAFGIFIDANKVNSAGKKIKKSYQEIYEEIVKIAEQPGIAGFNVARAADPEGKIQVLQNRLQDIREEIGNKILPVQAKFAEAWLEALTPENVKLLIDAVDWLFKQLTKLVDYLKNDLIPYLKSDAGQKQMKKLGDAFIWIFKHAKPLALTILGIVAALYAFQAATAAINLVTALANPVGLVVVALGILAALIYIVIFHWKEFKATIDQVWKSLGDIPIIGPALQLMMYPLKQIVDLVDWLRNLDWGAITTVISKTWTDTWAKIKHIWETAQDVFTKSWEYLKQGFTKLGKAILDALLVPINKVIDGVNTMINAVNKVNPFAKIPNVPRIEVGGAQAAAAAAAPTAAAQAAAAQMPLSPEGLKAVQAERASVIADLQRPELRNLVSATLATEAQGAEDQKNVLESLVNRAVAEKQAGTYKGVEAMIKGGFYGPYNRGETAAVMAKGLSDARSQQVGDMIQEIGAGRNALGGLTDQGMINEIHGAIKEQHGEDYYGLRSAAEANTAAYRYSRGYQEGGIARTPQIATLAEKGPEVVLPIKQMFNRDMGKLSSAWGGLKTGASWAWAHRHWPWPGSPSLRDATPALNNVAPSPAQTVHFSPSITINGNASESEQSALEAKLRNVAREFIANFNRAQYQERRLSYESGYG